MIRSSAPGNFFLLGEHSVLRRRCAIILALKSRVFVKLVPQKGGDILIKTPLGHIQTHRDALCVHPPLHYVLQTLKTFPPPQGARITITSELPAHIGQGSSAAVVVALLGALKALMGDVVTFQEALSVIHQVQGVGSGADVMASLKGGVGLYQAGVYTPLVDPISPLFWVYSGFKTPTATVVQRVARSLDPASAFVQALDCANEACVLEACACLDSPAALGDTLNRAAGIMESFGVHTADLSALLWRLRQCSWGVKLSGAGLGDCAIGVVKGSLRPVGTFPLDVASEGLRVEA